MENFVDRIFCKSCEDMSEVPNNSVDLILTSPPYEDARHYSDDSMDLGNYSGEEFLRRLVTVLRECLRVLKPSGNFFLNFQSPMRGGSTSLIESKIPITAVEEVGFLYIQTHYWFKSNAQPTNSSRNLKPTTESIWHFAKSLEYRVFKDAIREPSYWADRDPRKQKYHPKGKDPGNGYWTIEERLRQVKDPEDNVFVGKKSQEQAALHPAKMPDTLARRFILYGSAPGDLVLDPFAGSGTTLMVGKSLERHFVGYELNLKYVELIRGGLEIGENGGQIMVTEKKLFNINELESYLSIPKATLYAKVHKREIPFVKIGRSLRFDKQRIDDWVLKQQSPDQSITKGP